MKLGSVVFSCNENLHCVCVELTALHLEFDFYRTKLNFKHGSISMY